MVLVLVGLWLAVLIPMWLRNHDAAAEIRSVEGFSAAMRTLSRRTSGVCAAGRYVVRPVRGGLGAADVTVTGAAARRRSNVELLRRKQRLAQLVAVAGLTFLLAIAVGGLLTWVHVAVDVALLGYVGWLRQQRLAELDRVRRARREALLAREAEQRLAYEQRTMAERAESPLGRVVDLTRAGRDEDDYEERRVVGG
ncbi:MAG: hypothetical protein ABR520_07430 [Mycobacteriales bacterium]|nr:hypothetical protein [Frankia sp.]